MMSRDPAMVEDTRRDPLLLRHATARWYAGHRRAQAEALAGAGRLTLPLLTLQGGADPIADPAGAAAFHARAASADKSLLAYPGMLHEPLREADRQRVFTDIFNWIAARSAR
jgi:alpha-beta hydrolase superfamily lysophospholipase